MACQLKGHYAASFQDPNAPLNGNICPVDDVPCRGPKNRRYCSNTCKGKARHWRRQFNLTVEQARALIEWAGGKCPICKKNSLNLNMDHNHKTKLVYGPACAVCNTTLLAYSYHDPEIARRLLNFLENPPALALGIKVFAPEMSNKSRLHEMWEFTEQDRKIAAGGKPF